MTFTLTEEQSDREWERRQAERKTRIEREERAQETGDAPQYQTKTLGADNETR